MTDLQFLDTDAAFALHVKQLQDRLNDQIADLLLECGLTLPGKTTGIVQLLYSEGPCSKSRIAQRLRYSHQLTTQRLSWLTKNGMATTEPDPDDGRAQIVKLTREGEAEGKMLQVFLPKLRDTYKDLFQEIGFDLNDMVLQADSALAKTPLTERLMSGKS